MSKKKFNKLAASSAVVAGYLGYCGVIGVGIATLLGSDMCVAAQPLRSLYDALHADRRNPNMAPHIQKLEALRAEVVKRSQDQGDSGFADFLSEACDNSYDGKVGESWKDPWGLMEQQYPQLYRHIRNIQRDMIRGGENKKLPFGHIWAALDAAAYDRIRIAPITVSTLGSLYGIDFMAIKSQVEVLTQTLGRLVAADGTYGNTSEYFAYWVRNATNPSIQSRPMPQNVEQAVRRLGPNPHLQNKLIQDIDVAVANIRQARLSAIRQARLSARAHDRVFAPRFPALTTAPPSTINFQGCTRLGEAPPFQYLESATINFQGCTGLTKAPSFPVLGISSTINFQGFSKLTEAPPFPVLGIGGTINFQGCTRLGEAPSFPVLRIGGTINFQGCTGPTGMQTFPGPSIPSPPQDHTGLIDTSVFIGIEDLGVDIDSGLD
ncbi:MAG: hypothetical protein LBL30_01655 [Holosporales bacterium]|jgi:hypothetical protein|nr:hypothetical protein [Holosporales bacterium]